MPPYGVLSLGRKLKGNCMVAKEISFIDFIRDL